jgi:hypothetical protein
MLRRALLVAACLLLMFAVAPTPDASAVELIKKGASGQVYVWQSGSC